MPKPKVRLKTTPTMSKLDRKEFRALFNALDYALNHNYAAMGRLLGVSRKTIAQMNKEAPTWPWWNYILRHALKLTLAGLEARRRSRTSLDREYLRKLIAKIPEAEDLEDEIMLAVNQFRESEDHLRELLLEGPLPWSKIRLPANSGGFSPRTLQRAAKNLGVIQSKVGYGEDKDSYWSLPTAEDE